MTSLLGASHPMIWKFIEAIQKQRTLTELKVTKSTAGQPSLPAKKKYVKKADKIKSIVEYPRHDLIDSYLVGLAGNRE
ncbi:hypothetical protein R1flu_027152 [Riccia fluitans]|uniref:Mobile element protein n=1 Tax=Riccia fluitans TaxID=41844 RepID=A0ABD1XIK7_9MARC